MSTASTAGPAGVLHLPAAPPVRVTAPFTLAGLPALLRSSEVAEVFRVDVKTVRRWGREGRFTRVPCPGGGHNLYPRGEIEAFINAQLPACALSEVA